MVDSILRNGHSIIIFNTADLTLTKFKDHTPLQYISNYKHIINALSWVSNKYQFDNGAKSMENDNSSLPYECRHVDIGQHKYLNEYLLRYINKHNLL